MQYVKAKKANERDLNMKDDIATLEDVVRKYLDGFYEGDVSKLQSIFLPSATLNQVVDNKVACLSSSEWLERIAGRPSPKASGLKREENLLAIDLVGPTLAILKVQCAAAPKYFTDVLSCLKVDGKWFIAQKVFMTETR